MLGTSSAGSYRTLLADPRLRRIVTLVALGRFGYAVLPLTLLFTLSEATGSFPVAATASGVFGLGTLAMPLQARLVDRYGQRRVLPVVAAAFTSVLILVLALAAEGVRWGPAWLTVAGLAGALAPSLGPAMRAQWREATTPEQRAAAYSLDAVVEEMLFLVGPAVAAAFLAVGAPQAGVATTAVLVPAGALALAASPYRSPARTAAVPDGPSSSGPHPWRSAAFRRLLMAMGVSGLVLGSSLTAFAGVANGLGRPSDVGLVETAAGVTSLLGALLWGRRSPSWPWGSRLGVLMALRGLLFAAGALGDTFWGFGIVLALSGFALAPTFVVAYEASDEESEPGRHTEASTWVTTMTNVGISVGSAVGGWSGPALTGTVFAAGALALLAAAWVAARPQMSGPWGRMSR